MIAKRLRIFSIILLTLFILFNILLGTGNILMRNNRAKIENAIAEAINAKSVKMGHFFNIPFVYVRVREVEIDIDKDTAVQLSSITIYYNIFNLIFKGMESTISKIEVGDVKLASTLPAILRYARGFQSTNTNRIKSSPIKTIVRVDNFNAKLFVIGQIDSEINTHNFEFAIDKNSLQIDSSLFLNIKLSNAINYLKVGMNIKVDISDLGNKIGKGELVFSGLNLGGIHLFNNEKLEFTINKQIFFDIENSAFSNIINYTNDILKINVEKQFMISYEKHKEYYLFEHILETGKYSFLLNSTIKPKSFNGTMKIEELEKKEKIMLATLNKRGQNVYLKGRLETDKYGLIDADVVFTANAQLPTGRIKIRDISFIPGLKFSGIADAYSYDNKCRIFTRKTRMNGGFIGRAHTTLTLETNGGVIFESPKRGYNAEIEGKIFEKMYDMNIRVNRVPGNLVVANIKIDFFNIGRGIYNGDLHIYNTDEEPDIFLLKGNLMGHYKGKLLRATATVRDTTLKITDLYFYQNDMGFNMTFNFDTPDPTQSFIYIKGQLVLVKKYRLPFSGQVHSLPDENKAIVNFTVDRLIKVKVNAIGDYVVVNVNTKNYVLKRFDLPGKLDMKFTARLYNSAIQGIDYNINYKYQKRYFNLFMKSQKEKGKIIVKNFMFDADGEKLIAKSGSLWETKNRLNGKIYFSRGGSIKFASSFDTINAMIDLRNMRLRNFLKPKLNVFITTKLQLNGELVKPDVSGSCVIRNSVNSEMFYLNAPSIDKHNRTYKVKGLYITNIDYFGRINARLTLTDGGMRMSGYGKVGLFGVMSGNVSATYYSEQNKETLSYKINSFKIGDKFVGNMQGGAIRTKDDYQFYRMKGQGVAGWYNKNKNGNSDWNLDFFTPKVHGNFVGNIKNKTMNAKLKAVADLGLLSFQDDLFKRIEGEAKLNLNLKGDAKAPSINGMMRLYNTTVAILFIDTAIKKENYNIPIIEGKLVFKEGFKLATTSGDFALDGYIDVSDVFISYIDLKLNHFHGKEASINLNINDPFLRIKGKFFVENVRIFGPPLALNMTGKVIAKNTAISMALTPGEEGEVNEILEGLKWNLEIETDTGVKFSNPVLETIIDKNQSLTMLGCIGDASFTMKGDVSVKRGSITYFGRTFSIREGSATFNGDAGDPLPFINVETVSQDRDENGDRLEIFLTFGGKLSKLSILDFYSVPAKNKDELFALLGFEMKGATYQGTNRVGGLGADVVVSAANMAQSYLLAPLTMRIRRNLGLDMFTVRTEMLGIMARSAAMGYNYTDDPLALFAGTSIAAGKYLFSNLFLESELSWIRDPNLSPDEQTKLMSMFSVGLGIDIQNFYFGGEMSMPVFLEQDAVFTPNFELQGRYTIKF